MEKIVKNRKSKVYLLVIFIAFIWHTFFERKQNKNLCCLPNTFKQSTRQKFVRLRK